MSPTKKEIIRREKEFIKDRDQLIKTFDDFSVKYGNDIVSFFIHKVHNNAWKLVDVIMDNQFFHKD